MRVTVAGSAATQRVGRERPVEAHLAQADLLALADEHVDRLADGARRRSPWRR